MLIDLNETALSEIDFSADSPQNVSAEIQSEICDIIKTLSDENEID